MLRKSLKHLLPKNLNHVSKVLTQDPTQAASQAMMYALGEKNHELDYPRISISDNYYSGNPCNNHLNQYSEKIVESIQQNYMIGAHSSIPGVSDGMSMGTPGMRYSLPSRETIADDYESMNMAHFYDGNISVPGCDKNMPGALMGMIRVNRPSFMIYGGTIKPGNLNNEPIDIVNAFQSYGQYKNGEITNQERQNIVQCACPGSGACGGMYTANTMASIIETMGLTLPGSASNPALSLEKFEECEMAGLVMNNLLKKDLKPSDIITEDSIKNGIVMGIALGGSTNLVLHMLAIARTARIPLEIDDFNEIGKNVPVIGNLKPHGKYLMNDLYQIGGIPYVQKILMDKGLLNPDCVTITGQTLGENIETLDKNIVIKNKNENKNKNKIICHDYPIKSDSHIRIMRGNLAPQSAVAKISGNEGEYFKGPANVFETEYHFLQALDHNKIQEGQVIVIRNQGPMGGPGMPEMLKPTSAIVGRGMADKVAFLTDGRFSGGSHGFVIGHISPEAYGNPDAPIRQLMDGDIVEIDAVKNIINVVDKNKKNRMNNNSMVKNMEENKDIDERSSLAKFRKLVRPAEEGCVTF